MYSYSSIELKLKYVQMINHATMKFIRDLELSCAYIDSRYQHTIMQLMNELSFDRLKAIYFVEITSGEIHFHHIIHSFHEKWLGMLNSIQEELMKIDLDENYESDSDDDSDDDDNDNHYDYNYDYDHDVCMDDASWDMDVVDDGVFMLTHDTIMEDVSWDMDVVDDDNDVCMEDISFDMDIDSGSNVNDHDVPMEITDDDLWNIL
jgi:hypothetical protein